MKIYTKSGDDGTTGLYGGLRTSKTGARIRAIGDVDELNSTVGLARVFAKEGALAEVLASIQDWLFDIGAELACPPDGKLQVRRISMNHSDRLEESMDAQSALLPELKVFILPGGTVFAAQLHVCRSVCRRAERSVLDLNAAEPIRSEICIFLNRLSDWFFTSARTANHIEDVNDIAWKKSEAV